jgi:SAM-dependent methyltransferase
MVVGESLVDVLGGDRSTAESILAWPADFVRRAEGAIEALGRDELPPPTILDELAACGLAEPPGRLTPLGELLAYHTAESRKQAVDQALGSFQGRLSLDETSRVLDIGCGAGQTLRLLNSNRPGALVGVDVDLEALAFGSVLNRGDVAKIAFVRASAHTLPFSSGAFSHVICRVGLNYMHQAKALREMVRVLSAGGLLYVRVEGPGFDWKLLRSARGFRRRASRIADLTLGIVHAGTGRQPMPGTSFGGGRAFATAGRLTAILERAGCTVLDLTTTARGPLGLPLGVELLARRTGEAIVPPRQRSSEDHERP